MYFLLQIHIGLLVIILSLPNANLFALSAPTPQKKTHSVIKAVGAYLLGHAVLVDPLFGGPGERPVHRVGHQPATED